MLFAQPYVYYVAPDGNDSHTGTFAQPWATLQKAFLESQPGDTTYLRGGVYYSLYSNILNPEKYPTGYGVTGTSANPIHYYGYPPDIAEGNRPIIDCVLHCDSVNSYNSGISLSYVEHIKFKDIDVRNVLQCDGTITGAISAMYSKNLTYENMTISNIGQRAVYMQGGGYNSWYEDGGTATTPYWPDGIDTTIFRNIDIYDLCDTFSVTGNPPVLNPGNAADGFKQVYYRDNYIVWEDIRVWNYTDDAYDVNNINGAEFILRNCWVMSSRKYESIGQEENGSFEGNGFKFTRLNAGSPPMPEGKRGLSFINCLAMFCDGGGFYSNFLHDEGAEQSYVVYINNTSYSNNLGYNLGSWDGFQDSTILRNNLGYGNALYYGSPNNFYTNRAISMFESNNNYNWVGGWPGWSISDTVTVTDDDFTTVDSLTLVALFTASRQADGSLPKLRPLMLKEGSDLINAGTRLANIELASFGYDTVYYYDTAPDIGYYQYGQLDDSTGTDILSFTFPQQNSTASINYTNHTISIEVVKGTSVTSLTPTITLSPEATISPTSGTARNFTSPVTYTVTAGDEVTTQVWTVTVTVATVADTHVRGKGAKSGTKYMKFNNKLIIIQ